jgi:hypothetical protein
MIKLLKSQQSRPSILNNYENWSAERLLKELETTSTKNWQDCGAKRR